MDIRIDEVYSLKGKSELKFSLYEKRTTKEKIIVDEKGKKTKVPLGKDEEGITQDELIKSNLTLDTAIEYLISLKMKKKEETVSLKEWLEIYIEEKRKFEKTIDNLKSVLSTKN